MRLAFIVALPVLLIAGFILGARLLAGPPASERLAGVSLLIVKHYLVPGTAGKQDLQVQVVVTSSRDVDDCLAFTLDQPFGNRRMRVIDPVSGCVRPKAGTTRATVLFDRLSDDDLRYADHTLVWGVSGGKCGVILPLFGICAVDQAGTADLQLSVKSPLPFPSLGSFVPFPTFSLDLSGY
jgi:hypothetical protein